MYGKKPDQLTSDEEEHFEGYQEWKNEKGEPIDEDFICKPAQNFYALRHCGVLVAAHKAPTNIVIVQLNYVHYCSA